VRRRAGDARVVAIVGPTAVGKSALAQRIAPALDAEIVAVDAFTIYRGMDVATATPTSCERRAVPHHLVDELDPSQECTAQWFQTRARAAIADVLARDRRALLVGGSGLYFRAVVDPLEFPPTDPQVRAQLERRHPDAERARTALLAVDPAAAQRMDPANHRRAIRALEVYELTGRPFSEWQRWWDHYESIYPDLVVLGLDVPRPELRRRIGDRVDAMLSAGLLEEARRLRRRPLSATAAQAIGYAEAWAHLDGWLALADARERIIVRTRRYAVRQLRWFARDPRVGWLRPMASDSDIDTDTR
jgi:tRNA dimethylallyltransferase